METLDEVNSGLSAKAKEHLKGAAPWMKFVGVFFIVIGALDMLAVLGMFAMGMPFHVSMLIGITLIGLIIYCGLLVLRTGNAYGNYIHSNSSDHLEKAFFAQKQYWMILGILIILFLLLLIVSYGYVSSLADSGAFN